MQTRRISRVQGSTLEGTSCTFDQGETVIDLPFLKKSGTGVATECPEEESRVDRKTQKSVGCEGEELLLGHGRHRL